MTCTVWLKEMYPFCLPCTAAKQASSGSYHHSKWFSHNDQWNVFPWGSVSCLCKDFYSTIDIPLVSSFERKFIVVSTGICSCTKPKMLSFPFHVSGMCYNSPISFHMRSHKPSNSILSFFLCLMLIGQMKAHSHLVRATAVVSGWQRAQLVNSQLSLREDFNRLSIFTHLLIFSQKLIATWSFPDHYSFTKFAQNCCIIIKGFASQRLQKEK